MPHESYVRLLLFLPQNNQDYGQISPVFKFAWLFWYKHSNDLNQKNKALCYFLRYFIFFLNHFTTTYYCCCYYNKLLALRTQTLRIFQYCASLTITLVFKM